MNWALAALSAALLIATFPKWDFSFLAPVALAPLLVAIAREPSWRRRFVLGEFGGFLYWFGHCYWIQFVMAVHGGMGEAGGWATFALFALIKGLHWAVFAALAGRLIHRPWALPAVAALWTGLERTHGELGFTWLLLGNAAVDMGIPMRLAPYAGVFGVSFALAMMNAAVALLVLRRPRRELAPLLALVLLFVLPPLPLSPEPGREAALAVQTNVPQSARWDDASIARLIQRVVRTTLSAALDVSQQKPAIVLWPESPAPFYFFTDPVFEGEARRLARAMRTPFLFGTVAYTPESRPINSALLLSAGGDPVERYDKMYLVPFGEFVPPVFGFVNRITQEAGDFAAGNRVVAMPLEGGRKAGAFICYESAFPELVRRFADAGGEVLINLTNDGYFGRTSAREQHLLLTRMRAAENRRWLLRPTNDGYTVSIDPAGRIRQRMEPFQAAAGRLNFSWVSEKTFYTRHGDWFAWLCLIAAIALVAIP